MDARQLKVEAARAALAHVSEGMRLGIGTGSTAEEFVRLLAEKVATGLTIVGVPTSERTAALCHELGVPLSTLEETPELDLTIDGADEVDPALTLIKGGGGALLREKIVAAASGRMIVIADRSKMVETLGRFPLPIEVNQFGLRATEIAVACSGQKSRPFRSDYIEDDGGPAFCYRRRPFYPRCIFWPHSGYKSAFECSPRHTGRRRARSFHRAGVSGHHRRRRRHPNRPCRPKTREFYRS